MQPIRYELWDSAPARGDYAPYILHYKPETAKTKASVLLIPGSGYCINPARPVQEGDRVARYLCERGIPVFVLIYRVFPEAGFPAPLLDGRRAMRLVRYKAEEFDIDPTRIATLSYSAGGHLAASLVGYHAPLDGEGADEIDKLDYRPNYQALCYPVISLDTSKDYTHKGSAKALLGEEYKALERALSYDASQAEMAPPTFIFHNFDDTCVSVENTLFYAARLKALGTEVEMHIYPHGGHGIGIPIDDKPSSLHNRDWIEQFIRWLGYYVPIEV